MSRKYLESKGYTSARFQLIKVAPAIWEGKEISIGHSYINLSEEVITESIYLFIFFFGRNKSRFCDWDGRKTRARIKRTNGRKNKSLCQDDGGVYAW
uniref:Uncharacterized protein n=1 Tax=Glossina palpalis gambiensis TaxID=67801 RepID=A0A1B0BTB9_9MUSC